MGSRVSVRNYRALQRLAGLNSFDALVVSGSPASATQDDPWILREVELVQEAEQRGLPVLGVCFGAQLLARAYYGQEAVRRSPAGGEFGWHTVCRTPEQDPFLEGLPHEFTSFQHHMDEVVPQPGMQVLAESAISAVQAFRVGSKPVWGAQFHFEVTPQAGRDVLRKTRRVYEPLGLAYEKLIADARPTEVAPRLFENFLRTVK